MPEYFIHSMSFAAPFFGDESTGYVVAPSPHEALVSYAESYRHPAGLYAADCYASADAHHKGEKHLARWLCNKARVMEERTSKGSHSIYSEGPGSVEIDGEKVEIEDPKGGAVVA